VAEAAQLSDTYIIVVAAHAADRLYEEEYGRRVPQRLRPHMSSPHVLIVGRPTEQKLEV
jgi:hypothetical protein